MKTITSIISIYILIVSCSTIKLKTIEGNYYKKGKDFSYILKLNEDKTFIFTKKYYEVSATCQGKWNKISNDTISLICNEESFPSPLTFGYMNERDITVVILNASKVKIDNVILNKVQ
jgi:hypothetical protein